MNKTILKHNLVQMDSRDLIKYIQKEFPHSGEPYSEQKRKFQILKSLNSSDLTLAISRMTRIEASFDHTKMWTVGSVLIGTCLLSLRIMFSFNLLWYILIATSICLLLLFIVRKDRDIVITATYFKELLEQIKSEKGK